VGERAQRVGLNEATFRNFNEGVKQVSVAFQHDYERSLGPGLPEELEIVCECGRGDCADRLRISMAEYEHVRSDAELFALVPGHELPDFESVVEDYGRFIVVRKHYGEAAQLARDTDPRS
jgi:hypothetical protein